MTDKPNPTIGKDGKEYPLTPKQHAFVTAYRETGNATEAYRQSYDAQNMKDESIRVSAHKVLHNPKIQERLKELDARAQANVTLTTEFFVERLIRRADAADKRGDVSGATQAEALATKLLGMQVDKVDQTVRNATPADHKPDLSNLRRAAAEHGSVCGLDTEPQDKGVTIQ